jgi:hypothetical protein
MDSLSLPLVELKLAMMLLSLFFLVQILYR